jgi:chloramphenicol 3-O phosphotransferase
MIIFLNGTSSSGKTSIANKLIEKLKEPYFFFSVDSFLEPSMPKKINFDTPDDLKIIDRSISGFNKALGCYAQTINYMIVDHVLQYPNWIKEISEALESSEVCFVGVTAPLDIIESREKQRSDRQPGTARAQYKQISNYHYDILIDTSIVSPDQAADKIIENLKPGNALHKSANRKKPY